jgi:glycosyltransferase involved in cell wall biosynthesis
VLATVMKVLVLGIRGIPNVQGGIETHAEQLYARLSEIGCGIEAIVRTPFVPRGAQLFGSVRIRRIWSPERMGYEALVHSILGVLYAAFARPDILHIHGIGPAIVTPIARLFGLRVIVTHHGRDYEREKWGPFGRWVLRLGERLGMQWSHARIAISKNIADSILTHFRKESYLINNGVTAPEPRVDTQYVRQFGLEPGRYFLQVGRMVPEKRHLDLISAYKATKPMGWKLALVGAIEKDSYSRKVVAAAQSAGIVLTGYLGGDALRQIYSHAGAFVLPSSHEGLPIALLEALSYGLPVLVSDIPANIEVGLDESNYFPLGDRAALADRLMKMVEVPRDDEARSARRRWTAERFDWDLISARTLEVYRLVVSR